MDVELPNGVVIEGVPEGTSKEAVKAKAIAAGYATEADFGEQQPDPNRPSITGGRGMGAQTMDRNAYDEEKRIEGLREQSKQQGIPFARDLQEIGNAPELNAMNMDAIKASAGANFTFNDAELGKILEQQVGATIGQDLEGNYYAQMPSGGAYAINKPGFSAQDAIKVATGAAAFTPAGKAATLTGQAIGGMATQAAIEGGQAAMGGEVNPVDVLTAGAAPIALTALAKAGRKIIETVRPKSTNQYLDEMASATTQGSESKQIVTQESKQPIFELSNRQQAREGLKNGTVEGVGWKISPRGKLEADVLERDLVKAGMSDKAILTANRMSGGDRTSANKMVDRAIAYVKGVKGSEELPPNSVIGESAMERFRTVSKYQKQASRDIGSAVKESSSLQVGAEDLADGFMDSLEKLKVSFANDKADFTLSNLANSNTGPINTIFKRLSNSDGSFKDLHEIKQMIYEQVSYGTDPRMSKPISDKGADVLKRLASDINEKLRKAAPGYAEANDRFKSAAEVVYPFAKAMGRRFDPESELVDNLVGQELRKVLTNYASAPDMITAYRNLDEVARGIGGKFNDDIGNLIVLNSELERIGSFKAGSFQGVQEKVTDRLLERAGVGGSAAKAVLNEAKDRVMYETPSAETLSTLQKFKQLLNR